MGDSELVILACCTQSLVQRGLRSAELRVKNACCKTRHRRANDVDARYYKGSYPQSLPAGAADDAYAFDRCFGTKS